MADVLSRSFIFFSAEGRGDVGIGTSFGRGEFFHRLCRALKDARFSFVGVELELETLFIVVIQVCNN